MVDILHRRTVLGLDSVAGRHGPLDAVLWDRVLVLSPALVRVVFVVTHVDPFNRQRSLVVEYLCASAGHARACRAPPHNTPGDLRNLEAMTGVHTVSDTRAVGCGGHLSPSPA